jgi:hypothetical protein
MSAREKKATTNRGCDKLDCHHLARNLDGLSGGFPAFARSGRPAACSTATQVDDASSVWDIEQLCGAERACRAAE